MEVNKIDDDAGTLFLRLAQIFTAFIHYDISKPLSCQTSLRNNPAVGICVAVL